MKTEIERKKDKLKINQEWQKKSKTCMSKK
jgi:hypothetical protein